MENRGEDWIREAVGRRPEEKEAELEAAREELEKRMEGIKEIILKKEGGEDLVPDLEKFLRERGFIKKSPGAGTGFEIHVGENNRNPRIEVHTVNGRIFFEPEELRQI